MLLSNGANPLSIGDVDECLPLHFAVRYRPSVIRATSSNPSTPNLNRINGSPINDRITTVVTTSDDSFVETLYLLIEKTIEASKEHRPIDLIDKYGDTALHYAVSRTNSRGAVILLEQGANVNALNNQKLSPLHMAAKNGDLHILEVLLSYKADLSLRDEDGSSPLHIAAKEGQVKHAEFLNQCFIALESERVSFDGCTGEDSIVKAIVTQDKNGANLLHCAVESGNEHLINRIMNEDKKIEAIKLVNTKKQDGFTALHIAAEFGHYNIVKKLVRCQADLDVESCANETPLLLASKNNHYQIAAYLARACPEAISNIDDDGLSPLLIAAKNGHTEVTEVLLANGANVNDTDQAERNMVFLAAMEGNASYLNTILQRADIASLINECDQYQNTPLHAAAKNGHKRALLSLIRAGANTSAKNVEEETAFHKAAKFGQNKILEELNSIDSKLINDGDSNKDTALHLAAKGCHYKTVQLLIDLGADVGKIDYIRI